MIDDLKARDPELAEKVKKLKAEFSELKKDICKLYDELKKPIIDSYKNIKEDLINKLKPIAKQWTPIIKDIEVSAKRSNKNSNVENRYFEIWKELIVD